MGAAIMKQFRKTQVLMLICVAIAGCTSREKSDTRLSEQQKTAKTQLESQIKQAAQTKQTYHAMNNSELLQKLMEQSKTRREPFNSPAYRELKERKDVDSKALVALVKDNANAGGLLPLLLLRTLDNKTYLELPAKQRAKILTDALEGSKYFNVWGLPNFYLEDASRALIELGADAAPALKGLLSDTRPAPVFGSQEYMVYQQYHYRVCDYAFFLLQQIAGKRDFRLALSPAERDAAIKQLVAR
jgi:hypothetical protein